MDCSFLYIFFRAKGRNKDTWHVVQVRSTELVYNQVTVGDLVSLPLRIQLGSDWWHWKEDTEGYYRSQFQNWMIRNYRDTSEAISSSYKVKNDV